ncbi:hypothetical protein CRG98_045930 [Punica granatum]|uniref:Uncharacterized protein n=1 Tax=Punica granatum TaxID=22663 RepID=A0A2I0HPN2_PUNGR|nr:hypothetical protein CRG98_045930 [Punica granatum]
MASHGSRRGRQSRSRSQRSSGVLEAPHFSRVMNPKILQLGKISIQNMFMAKYGSHLSSRVVEVLRGGAQLEVVVDSSDAEVDDVRCHKEPKAAKEVEPSFAHRSLPQARVGGPSGVAVSPRIGWAANTEASPL